MLLALLCLAPATAEVLLSYDFDTGALTDTPDVGTSGKTAVSLVAPGRDGTGRCVLIETTAPQKYCPLYLRRNIPLVRNLTLSFDYRAEADGPTAYLGILIRDKAARQVWGSEPFGSAWRHVAVAVASLGPSDTSILSPETVFDAIQIYGRAKGDGVCSMKLWVDNLRLTTDPPESKVSDRVRTSHANPPLFDWPRSDGPSRLAFSRSPEFPPDATTVIETARNWHLPDRPLEPGTWYWRYGVRSALLDTWSDIDRVVLPAETHQFRTGPLDLKALAAKPHPRLVDAAAERRRLGAEGLAGLVRRAKSIHGEGIPDDCPIWVEGDPRWPTWIDWYGKAHGGITSRSGGRLEQLGRACAIADSDEVRGWTLALALKAAAWDPQGGSNMKRGDIGAHHFLRGLNSCYDALAGHYPAETLAPIRLAIEVRAGQFWDKLNPFRGNEYNNHAWLNAFGLSESGLVLTGELPVAADWAQYLLDLFVGRFLCGLGFQGDNNEGISYWGYGLSFVVKYADQMREVTGIDLYRHPWLAQTARFPLYTAVPGQYAVSFADTGQPNHGVLGPAQTAWVKQLGERTGDPYALWYGGGSTDVQPKPPIDLPPSIWYRFIGWAIFNTSLIDGRRGVTVAMRSGPFYAGHQHEDLNAFVIHAYGEKLAIDGGHYDWYGSQQFKNWSTLTRAHNSLLVDGRDQGSRKDGADGQIAAWFESPTVGYTVGLVADPDVYAGRVERFERRLVFVKPDFVIVDDRVQAVGGPARWDWLLQSVGAVTTDDRAGFALTSGRASLSGRFVSPADLKLAVTSGFPDDAQPVDRYSTRPSPPERTPLEYHLIATPAEQRESERFLAVMRVAEGQAEPLQATPLKVRDGVGAVFTGGEVTRGVLQSRSAESGRTVSDAMTTDAAVAGLIERRQGGAWFALGGTGLTAGRVELLRASAPVDIAVERAPGGFLADVRCAAEVKLSLPVEGGAKPVLLDGREQAVKVTGGRLEVVVPAGAHELIYPATLADRRGHPLPPLPVTIGERRQELAGYARRTAGGHEVAWWGPVEIAQADRYRLVVRPEPAPGVVVDGRAVDPGQGLWLTAGRHSVLLHGGRPESLALTPEHSDAVAAEMLPRGWQPPAGAALREAEKPAAEGAVKGRVVDKVAASGGQAHCVWDTDGQWAEWSFELPRAGSWRLLVRGAGDDGRVLRGLSLDGNPLPGAGVLALQPTGGWCRDQDDWRWFRTPPVTLTAGRHVLRMERLGGSMNLDQIGWAPAE